MLTDSVRTLHAAATDVPSLADESAIALLLALLVLVLAGGAIAVFIRVWVTAIGILLGPLLASLRYLSGATVLVILLGIVLLTR